MAFTVNMTGTAEVDDSIIKEFDRQFLLAYESMGVADQFVSLRRDIGAESISIPRYDHLALATTPLSEKDDVDSEALADSKVILTPKEYGNVVTTTKLANLQSGGMADRAAAQLVGINMARTMNKLACFAMDASTNKIVAGAGTLGALTAGDVMEGSLMDQVYNKLARISVPAIGSEYVMLAHDDVIHDLRSTSAAGTWLDVHKYSMPGEVLKNEVGMYKGFRVIRENLSTISADVNGTVDAYNSYFIGLNGLGKGVSEEGQGVISGPFDKLQRFANIGWRGCFEYKIVQQDAIWVVQSASSVGENA